MPYTPFEIFLLAVIVQFSGILLCVLYAITIAKTPVKKDFWMLVPGLNLVYLVFLLKNHRGTKKAKDDTYSLKKNDVSIDPVTDLHMLAFHHLKYLSFKYQKRIHTPFSPGKKASFLGKKNGYGIFKIHKKEPIYRVKRDFPLNSLSVYKTKADYHYLLFSYKEFEGLYHPQLSKPGIHFVETQIKSFLTVIEEHLSDPGIQMLLAQHEQPFNTIQESFEQSILEFGTIHENTLELANDIWSTFTEEFSKRLNTLESLNETLQDVQLSRINRKLLKEKEIQQQILTAGNSKLAIPLNKKR